MLSRILRKSLLFCLLCLAFVVAVSTSARAHHRVEYSDFEPAPMGSLRVARPTLAWRIVPHRGSLVTAVHLLLNSQIVPAEYARDRHSVWYVPEAPLKCGCYSVHCSVTLDDAYEINKDWQFQVKADAVETLAPADKRQLAVCDAVNDVRRTMNLPALTVDHRLCAAASLHSAYLAQNHAVGHDQKSDLPGFLGEHVADRVHAFGFAGGCYETVSQGPSGAAAVRTLVDAPYHRAPFLQPGIFEIGAGVKSDVTTLLFGAGREAGVVTYPADGQAGVPVSWNGIEEPNPMRMHRQSGSLKQTGYVISLFRFGPDDPHLTVASATLARTDGKLVPVYINTSQNDDYLQNGVLIIPQQGLQPGATYRVTVKATDDAGEDCSRTWSFTTSPAQSTSLAATKK